MNQNQENQQQRPEASAMNDSGATNATQQTIDKGSFMSAAASTNDETGTQQTRGDNASTQPGEVRTELDNSIEIESSTPQSIAQRQQNTSSNLFSQAF